MAEVDAKVNMSLDDIIKMEKKKKAAIPKAKRGGAVRGGRGTMRGNTRGNTRGNLRGTRGNMGGNMRGNMRGRNNMNNNRRGQWKRYPQNNLHGGFIKKRYNNSNNNIKSNLTRSRSNMSLNRMNLNGSPRSIRGGFASRRGGRGGLTRSRSRTNLVFNNKPMFVPNKNKGFLKRTTSMPNLRDPSSVYNRLGYQNPAQVAYRNRVKRAKNVLLQRQTKSMRMENALSLSPLSYKNMSPLKQVSRQFNANSLRSDQIIRAQKRNQYEQKLMRMRSSRATTPVNMSFINSMNAAYNSSQHPAMALYAADSPPHNTVSPYQRQPMQRGRSPFRQSLQSLKAATKAASRSASFSRSQQRRSRSRSRSRPRIPRNSISSLTDAAELEDRSFSEVMYSLSNNFGVTGRTLNDRFSLF